MAQYYTYIMASKPYGTLYVGVTSNLIQRVWQHKKKHVKGFTEKYNVDTLVYYEQFEDIWQAIKREKHIKEWRRNWKIQLIEQSNPQWLDLYYKIIA